MSLGSKPRGCGKARAEGGIYIECGSPEGTRPLSDFLCDPVIPADSMIKALGLSPVGTKIVEDEKTGRTYVYDWVGESHYPNAADFIEEAQALGISRRISKTSDFSKLGPNSFLVLIHPKAFIANDPEWLPLRPHPCPGSKAHGDGLKCIGNLWLVLDPRSTRQANDADPRGDFPEWAKKKVKTSPEDFLPSYLGGFCRAPEVGIRDLPALSYAGRERPFDESVVFAPGIFCVVPITNLAVVESSNKAEQYESLNAAQASTLPVLLAHE